MTKRNLKQPSGYLSNDLSHALHHHLSTFYALWKERESIKVQSRNACRASKELKTARTPPAIIAISLCHNMSHTFIANCLKLFNKHIIIIQKWIKLQTIKILGSITNSHCVQDKGPSINDITQMFPIFGPSPPLSLSHSRNLSVQRL